MIETQGTIDHEMIYTQIFSLSRAEHDTQGAQRQLSILHNTPIEDIAKDPLVRELLSNQRKRSIADRTEEIGAAVNQLLSTSAQRPLRELSLSAIDEELRRLPAQTIADELIFQTYKLRDASSLPYSTKELLIVMQEIQDDATSKQTAYITLREELVKALLGIEMSEIPSKTLWFLLIKLPHVLPEEESILNSAQNECKNRLQTFIQTFALEATDISFDIQANSITITIPASDSSGHLKIFKHFNLKRLSTAVKHLNWDKSSTTTTINIDASLPLDELLG